MQWKEEAAPERRGAEKLIKIHMNRKDGCSGMQVPPSPGKRQSIKAGADELWQWWFHWQLGLNK